MPENETSASDTHHPAHIWFLLDRSGSMSSLFQDVVLGLQEFVREQRLADPQAYLTLVQFDSEDPHELMLDGERLEAVDEAAAIQAFDPRAATPLYDAIAALIGRADKHIANGADDSDQLVVIFTDGFENASTDCTRAKAFELIKERRQRGWTFAFLGADQDAFQAGEAISIARGSAQGFAGTGEGTRAIMTELSSRSAEHLRASRSARRDKRDRFFEDD